MGTTKKTICSRDCYSNCGLLVTVESGKAVSIKGDSNHPYNKGILCPKSQRFLDLVYSRERLLYPLQKKNGRFQRISWDTALELLSSKLLEARENYGPTAIYHHTDYAHSGVLQNSVDKRFFNSFGGCTRATGSLCLSGGRAAIQASFGDQRVSDPDQLEKAELIILWGSNPVVTNVPLLPYIQAARKKGAIVYLIDPIRTDTAQVADKIIQPLPGSDIDLVLGLAKEILKHGTYDQDFICSQSQGFELFKKLVFETTSEQIASSTGLDLKTIQGLAADLGKRHPVTIIAGWGLQRHANGPQMIRALANLVALTGSIGVGGGGIQYAHSLWSTLGDITGDLEFEYEEKLIQRGELGSSLLKANPGIQVAVINKSNPLVQTPQPQLVEKALQSIPFVVVLDLFMTPTAARADLILPVTSFLEGEDLYFNSWHYYLSYADPVIQPVGESRSDADIFLELASRLNCFSETKLSLLNQVIAPLRGYGVTLGKLREEPWRYPTSKVAWAGRKFASETGLFQFWSGQEDGFEYTRASHTNAKFPYTLLTTQPKERTHSQGGAETAGESLVFYLHPKTAAKEGLKAGEGILVQSPVGQVSGVLEVNEGLHPQVVLSYNGVWPRTPKEGLNTLIPENITAVGDQATLYDCPCNIRGR